MNAVGPTETEGAEGEQRVRQGGTQASRRGLTGGVGTCEGGWEAARDVFSETGFSGTDAVASMGSVTNWKTESHSGVSIAMEGMYSKVG